MGLSVSIICMNNQATIGRTLESVRGLATEIVAVDSGSTDGTIALLESHGARVIRSDWLGYVRTKQKALDECRGEWVLCLDSDESVLPNLAESVRGAIAQGERTGYMVNRKVYYRDRPLNHAWQPDWKVRLVKRGSAAWEGLDPHDTLRLTTGDAGTLTGDLRHDSITTFAEFVAKQARHSETMARSLLTAGKRGSYWKLLTSPPAAFLKQMVLKQAWRDGWPGWLAAASVAAGALMKHMALIELSRGKQE